jgi:hypothetical protein
MDGFEQLIPVPWTTMLTAVHFQSVIESALVDAGLHICCYASFKKASQWIWYSILNFISRCPKSISRDCGVRVAEGLAFKSIRDEITLLLYVELRLTLRLVYGNALSLGGYLFWLRVYLPT